MSSVTTSLSYVTELQPAEFKLVLAALVKFGTTPGPDAQAARELCDRLRDQRNENAKHVISTMQ